MTYKKIHFNNCRFNPFDEIEIGIEEKLAKYIVCLYDPKSPLIRGEQNLVKRRSIAAEIAGATFEHTDETFVAGVQKYLQEYAKSMEWALLVSLEIAYWEYILRLQQPIKDEKDTDSMRATAAKTSLAKDAKLILDMYKTETSIFYNDDADLVESIGKIRRFTPESIGKIV